jgi:hypothetical protein
VEPVRGGEHRARFAGDRVDGGPSSSRRLRPSYPTVCIPSPPPDLDCGDVPYTGFPVQSPDPHRFDGDHDGRGCEG